MEVYVTLLCLKAKVVGKGLEAGESSWGSQRDGEKENEGRQEKYKEGVEGQASPLQLVGWVGCLLAGCRRSSAAVAAGNRPERGRGEEERKIEGLLQLRFGAAFVVCY